MKKILLTILMSAAFYIAQAQYQPIKQDRIGLKFNKNEGVNFNAVGHPKSVTSINNKENSNRAVTKTAFTGSRNAYGLIVTESTCLSANQQTNTILFTHRISDLFTLPNDNSGFIQNTFSSNYGATWDSLIQTNHTTHLCRYPSGVIFNPAGNTTPGNAFATVSGPITEGSGWLGNFFSSAKLDSTNIYPFYQMDNNPGVTKQGFARIGYNATDVMTVVTGGLYLDPNGTTVGAQGYRGAVLNYARPDSANPNAFVWTIDSIKPNFKTDNAGDRYAWTMALTAWNKAGTIGYVMFNAIDDSASGPMASYTPLVYKTTDGGTSWNQLPLFDFSSLPEIAPTLIPSTGGGAQKAFFATNKGIDAAVDENGQLHVFSTIVSGYSNHPDSLDYTYAYNATSQVKTFYMFDTYTTANGWNATLVDSLNTDNAVDYSPFIDENSAPFEIDARLQMSRSDDGSKLFFFWLDSEADINEQVENSKPNIFGKGYDVTNQKWTYTKKFTDDDQNYFMYVSDIALQSGTNYKIPATISLPALWPNDVNMINPMRHYFVSGIEFDQADFVNVKNIGKADAFEVSANIPNPFSQLTSFYINLTQSSNVTIDIYNTLGTKVVSYNKGNLTAGKHTITIDGSDLASGLYFYTVNSGGKSVTRKMIVKK